MNKFFRITTKFPIFKKGVSINISSNLFTKLKKSTFAVNPKRVIQIEQNTNVDKSLKHKSFVC